METKTLDLKKIQNGLTVALGGKNASRVLVAAGLLGILLIFLSGMMAPKQKNQDSADQAAGYKEAELTGGEDYEVALATRLEATLAQMAGVGEVKVLVTLQQDAEYVYAKESKDSLDQTESRQGESGVSTQSKESREDTYLILEDSQGKQALLTTRLQPRIQGVVVVCTGGSNPTVAAQVTEAVTTALGIGSSRVCVAPLG